MIGRKTGRVTSCAAILRFVEEAEEAYKRNLWRRSQYNKGCEHRNSRIGEIGRHASVGIPKWPISKTVHLQG
jgi:hypothetical protein